MSRGALLALAAMKKGLAELEAKATKARKAVEDCMSASSEFIAVQREAFEVMGDVAAKPRESLKKLEALKSRDARARRLMNQDLVKLLDKQHEAEFDARCLREHIEHESFSLRLRGVLKEEGSKTK